MTTDDACTLTIQPLGFGTFSTVVQSPGWTGPISDSGNGKFIIWDETANGFVSPRTTTFRERTIRCLWKDRIRIQWLLVGPPPAAHPDDASVSVESVTDEGVVGEDNNGNAQGLLYGSQGQVAYTYARLKIRYVPWISYTVETDFGVEPLVVTNTGPVFTWPDGTWLDQTECPSVRQSTAVYRLTRYDFLTIPDFSAYNGYVNDSVITIDGHAKPIGTLLMDGASTHTVIQSSGQPYKTFECIIKYKPNGWNNFYRASTGTFQLVKNMNGQTPYQTAPLSIFFIP